MSGNEEIQVDFTLIFFLWRRKARSSVETKKGMCEEEISEQSIPCAFIHKRGLIIFFNNFN